MQNLLVQVGKAGTTRLKRSLQVKSEKGLSEPNPAMSARHLFQQAECRNRRSSRQEQLPGGRSFLEDRDLTAITAQGKRDHGRRFSFCGPLT